jgi:hypothetical protein
MTAVHLSSTTARNRPWDAQNAVRDGGRSDGQTRPVASGSETTTTPHPYYHHHNGGGGSSLPLTCFYLSKCPECPKCCSDAPNGDSAGQRRGQPGQAPAAPAGSLGERTPCCRPRRPDNPRVRVIGPCRPRRSCNHHPQRRRPLLRLSGHVATGPRSWKVTVLSSPGRIPAALLVPAPQRRPLLDHGAVNLDGLCRQGGLYGLEGVGKKNRLCRRRPPFQPDSGQPVPGADVSSS